MKRRDRIASTSDLRFSPGKTIMRRAISKAARRTQRSSRLDRIAPAATRSWNRASATNAPPATASPVKKA